MLPIESLEHASGFMGKCVTDYPELFADRPSFQISEAQRLNLPLDQHSFVLFASGEIT